MFVQYKPRIKPPESCLPHFQYSVNKNIALEFEHIIGKDNVCTEICKNKNMQRQV